MSEPAIRTFRASDGYELHYRHFPASTDLPRVVVVGLHGIQSHSGWYEYSSGKLAEAGFEVNFLDRRGSGLNSHKRGDAPHADRLIADVVQFLQLVRHEIQQRPGSAPTTCVLMGVSWGGKLAAAVAARRPELVDGLALLYPGIFARVRARADQRRLIRLANAWGKGGKPIKIPLDDPKLFTGDPHWQLYIEHDPLALREVTVSFLDANLTLDALAQNSAPHLRCPVLMMLAGRDEIIDNRASARFFLEMAAARKRLVDFPAARHTLEFEPNRDEFIRELQAWLNECARPRTVGKAVSPMVPTGE